MKRILFALLLEISIIPSLSYSTTIHTKKTWYPLQAYLPIRVSGYVKWEAYADSRQVVGSQNDQFLLYPEPKDCDTICQDINAHGQFEMAAIQTRLHIEADGPSISKATSLGVIEADFYGKSNIPNIVRMRLAYLRLSWEKVSILAGQYWHPLYATDAYVRTISFNSGSPMDAYSRDPQLRIIWTPTPRTDVIFATVSELDTPSDGPIGFSTTYMRNAIVPMLNAHIKTKWREHVFGAGCCYKRIVPRLETNMGIKAHESLNSFSAIAYSAFNWEHVSTYNKIMFVQNAVDHNMTGGYAVRCVDASDDHREYANLNGIAYWNDTEFNYHDKFIPGWFVGIVKNLGARTTILQNVTDDNGTITDKRIFGLGTDIDYLVRVSPRLTWKTHNYQFSAEFEYTRAAYGTIDSKGSVINTNPVGNFRVLLAMFYYL